jgi:hypothetical protein
MNGWLSCHLYVTQDMAAGDRETVDEWRIRRVMIDVEHSQGGPKEAI